MGRTSKNWCESVEKTRKIGGILVLHRRGEMGLDESAMLYEFGLSEQDPAAADRAGWASGKTEGDKADTSADVSGSPAGETEGDNKGAPKVLKRLVFEEEPPTAADMIARLETIETKDDLQAWRDKVKGMDFSVLNQKGLDYMASLKEKALDGGVYDDMLADQWNVPQPTPAPIATPTPTAPKPAPIIEYVVKSGDAVERIALENGCTIAEIMELNNLPNANEIYIDQILSFPQRLGEYTIMPERASEEGLEFVKFHESLRLNRYDDLGPGKVNCTIGYGHKIHDDPCDGRAEETEFLGGITEQRALELFDKDISDAADSVRLYVQVPLNKNQFDALVSFVYNVGRGTLPGSALLEFINEGQYEKVPEMMMINHIYANNGEEIEGLKNRRQDEADLFTSGVYNE